MEINFEDLIEIFQWITLIALILFWFELCNISFPPWQGAVDSSIRNDRELVKLEDSYFKSKLSKQLQDRLGIGAISFHPVEVYRRLPKFELLHRSVLLSRSEPLKVMFYLLTRTRFSSAPDFFPPDSNFVLAEQCF